MTLKPIVLRVVVLAALILPGFAFHHSNPCDCQTTVYKRKKSTAPVIVAIIRDSASQKALPVSALVVKDIIMQADTNGRIYLLVPPKKKYKMVAKAFSYAFCTHTICTREGDSIVCVFNMRYSRKRSDSPGDFIHK
jgi:hypothetical protein